MTLLVKIIPFKKKKKAIQTKTSVLTKDGVSSPQCISDPSAFGHSQLQLYSGDRSGEAGQEPIHSLLQNPEALGGNEPLLLSVKTEHYCCHTQLPIS